MKILKRDSKPLRVYRSALMMTFQNISIDETIGNKATLNFVVSWYLKFM